jgi:hypothetical protein
MTLFLWILQGLAGSFRRAEQTPVVEPVLVNGDLGFVVTAGSIRMVMPRPSTMDR